MTIAINTNLEIANLAKRFACDGRIHIRNFLEPESANDLHKILSNLRWTTVFNHGEKNFEMPPDRSMALSVEQRQQLTDDIYRRARNQYQFFYLRHDIVSTYIEAQNAGSDEAGPFAEFFTFMNSASMLEFARIMSGNDDVKWIDGQATLYGPGHFLNQHTDHVEEIGRVAAYVMNFTPKWDEDWGGYLEFYDDDGHMTGGFKPSFNALNMFSVPTRHSVGYVPPYAGATRLSITGWLRCDDPPGTIG